MNCGTVAMYSLTIIYRKVVAYIPETDELALIVGCGLTVMVTVAIPVHPFISVPVTV